MTIASLLSQDEKEIKEEIRKASDLNAYIIEIIRVSEKYRFHAKSVKTRKIERSKEDRLPRQKTIDFKLEEPEIAQERGNNPMEFTEIKVEYHKKEIRVSYEVKETKIRPMELHELTGFYQEKTTQAKLRVQIWPEHNFYDHFKRKGAFLFC